MPYELSFAIADCSHAQWKQTVSATTILKIIDFADAELDKTLSGFSYIPK
jgi:hypothetical protein